MTPSFNLISEPWIPCVTLDGKNVELGLRDTLFRAHELREIMDNSPLVTASLYRLILAILHRNFGPSSDQEWITLWNHNQFNMTSLDSYFQKWEHRFDLFDSKRPFYQVPNLVTNKLSSIARIALECADGNNDTLFDHNAEISARPRNFASAARHLVAIQNYALTGRLSSAYPVAGNLVKGAMILLKGNSLFDTLLFNLLVTNGELSTCIPSSKEDKPAWELENVTSCCVRPVNGYVDYLTWQSRMLRLIPDERELGSIRNLYLDAGHKCSTGLTILDPFFSFFCDKEKGFYPFSLRENKAIWRDSAVLLQRFTEKYRQPLTFKQLDRLIEMGAIEETKRYNIMIMGMNTDKAKIKLWRHETMPLPLVYFRNPENVGILVNGITLAEDACRLLRESLKTLSSRNDGIQHFWAMMAKPFFDFYTVLPDDAVHSLEIWWGRIRNNIWNTFELEAEGAGDSARNLKGIAAARAKLGAALKKIDPMKGGEQK